MSRPQLICERMMFFAWAQNVVLCCPQCCCAVLKWVLVSWKESEVIFGSVCQELGVRTRHLEKFTVFFGNTVDVGVTLVFLIPVPLLSGVLVRVVLPSVSGGVDCVCVAFSVGVLITRDVWLKMS